MMETDKIAFRRYCRRFGLPAAWCEQVIAWAEDGNRNVYRSLKAESGWISWDSTLPVGEQRHDVRSYPFPVEAAR